MNQYATAAEAKTMALEAQSIDGAYLREETDRLMKRIVERAAMGLTSLVVYDRLDSVIISRITHLGYSVKLHTDQFDGYSCSITWN